MNIKSKKKIIAGLFLLVCILAFVAISAARTPTALYADLANPFLQVTCGSENKSDTGWTWETDESYNGTLTLNGYDGKEISIGGVDNGKVNIVLVGENKITVTAPYAPYGNRAIYTHNVSTLTFKGDGSLTIDYQVEATSQIYMRGIFMEGESSSKNDGNLVFDENCTVTVKVYGTVAENNGSVDAIYMKTDAIGSGNVTVKENATLNIDLKCDKDSQTYGIFAKGNVVFDGTVDIKMEYTGSGTTYDTWRDVSVSSSYSGCLIGTNAKITSVCPGRNGSTLTAFPLVANGAQKISSWTCIASSEQYFENDDCLVHVWNKAADNISFKNYSYTKLATPLTFEDKAEYDVPATVYGDNAGAYSSIALSASGGSGEYTFSVVSAADGNTSGVGVSSNESDLNKIYVAPNLRGVSEATEITVKVTDKGGYSKTITVNIGAVAAPTYSATVDPVDFGTVRVGYGTQDAVYVTVKNTGTGKIFTNGASVTLEGENASDYFTLQCGSVPTLVYAGSTMTNWWIKPKNDLPVGIYTATIKFSGTPEYSQYGGSSVQATATVSFVVTEHDFNTSVWESDGKTHWNPCKDTGCAVRGNEAAHDKDGELTGYAAADFNNDGNTGTKHCSVCGAVSEEGSVIPAGKYIRVSQATMEPAAITNEMTAEDLVFTSGDNTKYTVAFWRAFDLTDNSLNTDVGGTYPKDRKFIADHKYAIEIEFNAVGSYEYETNHSTHWSTFTVDGQPTEKSAVTAVGGSPYRRITLTATDATIPVTITEVQISFSEVNVKRGNYYSFTATVSGTGAFDNSVTWSVTGGSAGTTVSGDGVLTVAANESAATLTIKAVANGDSGKYAIITVNVVSLITVNQKSGNQQYTVAAGGTINLTAETAASGYHFKEWQVSGAGTFTDKNAKETVFTVPCENVTVTAVYELHSASGETWQTNGTSHWHLCSCGEKVNVAPHNPDRAAATETEPVKCTECGYVITPALGHTEHTAGSVWFSDGASHWHVCTGCSEKLDVSEHTYGAWTVTVQPQVGIAGEKERECSVCGYKDIAPVDALAEQITVTVVGGKINGNASVTVDKNESVTVVADEAPAGKMFKGWSADGGQTIISESASYTFNATENVTLTAVYADVNAGGTENTGEQGGEQSEKTESSGCGSAVTFGSWILPVILTLLGGIAALLYNRRRAKTHR